MRGEVLDLTQDGHEGIILVHGLPKGEPARLQLDAVKFYLSSFGLNPILFDWETELAVDPPSTYRLLNKAQFVHAFAHQFTSWLQTDPELAALGSGPFGLVSYSLGGMGFYGWVTDPETPADCRRKVALAVAIASPYQFSTNSVIIEKADGTRFILHHLLERRIDPETIVRSFPGQLKLLLAGRDPTILPDDSEFPDHLVGLESVPTQKAARYVVPDATHRTIVLEEEALKLLGTILSP